MSTDKQKTATSERSEKVKSSQPKSKDDARRQQKAKTAAPLRHPEAGSRKAGKPAVAANAVKEPRPVKPLITSNIVRYSERVVREVIADKFKETFAPTHLKTVSGEHLHPWSHACRAEAIIDLFFNACKLAESRHSPVVDVLSYYGSDSEHRFVDAVNAKMGNRGPHIRLTTYCAHKFQGDAVRHYKRAVDNAGFDAVLKGMEEPLFHGVHMVDIYQCGSDPRRGLDPAFLSGAAKFAYDGRVRCVLRQFFGQAGCDEATGGPQEGVWYRDSRGFVVFYPEGSCASIPYAPHPDCNWMFSGRHCKGLALAVPRVYGPYRLVEVVIEENDAIELIEPVDYQKGDFQIFTPEITGLQELILSADVVQKVFAKADRALPQEVQLAIAGCTPVTAHANTVKTLAGANDVVLNGFAMKGLRDKVMREFERDPKINAMRVSLPSDVYASLVEGTVLAVTYYRRKKFARQLLGARKADAATQEMFIKAFSANPGATVYITARRVMLGVAGVTFVAVTGSWLYLFAHAAVAHGVHFTMLASGKYAPRARSLSSVATAGVVGTALLWRKGCKALTEKFSSSRSHYDEYCRVVASGGEEAPCVKTYLEHLAQSQPFSVPLQVDDTIPCAAVPRKAIAHPHGRIEIEVDRQPVSFETAVELVDCEPQGCIYPTLHLACGLTAPSNVSGNALHAMAARALPDLPLVDYDEVARQARHARELVVKNIQPLESNELLTLEACADLMPARPADRFRRTVEEIANGRVDPYMYTKKKTMLKLNETIKVGPAIKARLLDCLEPAHTVATMQAARGTLTSLKRSFSVEHGFIEVGDWRLHIIICSGKSPDEMDVVGEVIQVADVPTILIAGDDCTIYWGSWEGVAGCAATEVDGEKFDITQSIELLEQTKEVFRYCMQDCSIESEVFEYFTAVAVKPLKWSDRKKFVIRAYPRSRAPTGTTFTTAMNCVATLFWVVNHFRRFTRAKCTRDELLDVASAGSQLGFRLTVEHHASVHHAIFLKGVFLEAPDGSFRFCTLPSQILKLGKTIQKPTMSQREKDPRKAMAMTVGAMGRSMPLVADDLPLLGPFLAVLRRHGDADEKGEVEELNDNPYKVVGSNLVTRDVYMAFVCHRYGTTKDEIEELEDMLTAVNQLPVLLSHPLVARLALRDYY